MNKSKGKVVRYNKWVLFFCTSAEVPQPAEGERPELWMNAAMGSRVPA